MQRQLIILLLLFLFGWSGIAQQIILDKPLKAGDLTLFPDMNKQTQYYYVADQAKLALDKNGKPHFSFLRYVDGAGASGKGSEVGGGGIVHAVVSLAVTDEQLNEARQALRRLDAIGTIQGPVIFESGRFALVSSFTGQNGELANQVVGVGKAPILDGQKAAISIFLTKLGSQLLWESFRTSTPDISFSFEMTLGGYRLPKRAKIDANFADIYKSFDLGVQLGFNLGDSETVDSKEENSSNNKPKRARNSKPKEASKTKNSAKDSVKGSEVSNDKKAKEGADEKPESKKPEPKDSNTVKPETEKTEKKAKEETPSENTENKQGLKDKPEEVTPAMEIESENETETNEEDEEVMGAAPNGNIGSIGSGIYVGAEMQYVFEELRKTGAIKVEQFGDDEDIDNLVSTAYNKLADLMFDQIESSNSNQPNVNKMLSQLNNQKQNQQQQKKLKGIMFSYKMKEKRRTGEFHFDLNKWTNDEIVMRFDHPIGNLTKYQNDDSVFKMVNTDDPAFDQREIFSVIDGYNAEDFGEYINFVSVHMQKKHAKGHITDREIIINRENYNQQGNNFSMMYGWHGDDDRSKWMQYQYEILWSFFGDIEYKESFQPSTYNAINLAPPYQKNKVEIEADPELLKELEVRMVSVKLYYKVEGKEFMKQVTLIPNRDRLSEQMEFLSLSNNQNYEYEITWRLKGNRVVKSGRLNGSDNFLFVDELPEN